MNIKDFPNPKLNLPKELKTASEKNRTNLFQSIENYIYLIQEYIYTDINLNYQPTDTNHNNAWIQKIVSANLLRSLYIRNAFVEEINNRNFVGMFLPLKAWFEINGVLASILDLIEKNLSPKELDEKLKPFALGNKGKSKVGQIEATNVLTMIEKADKYMTKIIKENNSPTETFFSYFYDIASNPSHPSFDAQEMVGSLMDEGVWTAKSPEEIKNSITIDIDNYGGLLMSPLFIKNICENIFTIEKDNFAKLKSKKYFN